MFLILTRIMTSSDSFITKQQTHLRSDPAFGQAVRFLGISQGRAEPVPHSALEYHSYIVATERTQNGVCENILFIDLACVCFIGLIRILPYLLLYIRLLR